MATELAPHLSTVCCGCIMPDADKAFQGHVRQLPPRSDDDERAQRYVVQNMMTTRVSSYAHPQAARSYVKGYENLHGCKLRFETIWLDK